MRDGVPWARIGEREGVISSSTGSDAVSLVPSWMGGGLEVLRDLEEETARCGWCPFVRAIIGLIIMSKDSKSTFKKT